MKLPFIVILLSISIFSWSASGEQCTLCDFRHPDSHTIITHIQRDCPYTNIDQVTHMKTAQAHRFLKVVQRYIFQPYLSYEQTPARSKHALFQLRRMCQNLYVEQEAKAEAEEYILKLSSMIEGDV